MALWVCTECSTAYSVGAPCCPHCRSTVHVEEGQEVMAKITVHGGPSNAAADAEAQPEQAEGSEPSSAGSSSQTSTEPPQPSPKTSEPEDRSPARTTGSRSRKARTANSSANGTAGDPEADTSASSDN